MDLPFSIPDGTNLPTPPPLSASPPVTVCVHALSAGHFSLPEEQFVHPSSPGTRKTVPSLCFLVQHTSATTGVKTNVVFDLGLRRDIARYSEPIRRHVATRQPMSTDPDVAKSLAAGGLEPDDIDYVVYSHVHWDHVGEPRDFLRSTFVVGHGSLAVLAGNSATLRGSHSFFEPDLLDLDRVVELPDPSNLSQKKGGAGFQEPFCGSWNVVDGSPPVLDVFGDGSLYVVDAPGHLPGHINLLARVSDENPDSSSSSSSRWIYLAGDACHDRRILRGDKSIGEWRDAAGHICCIHADRAKAEETIERIRLLERNGVEVIFAHDVEWESNVQNRDRFFSC